MMDNYKNKSTDGIIISFNKTTEQINNYNVSNFLYVVLIMLDLIGFFDIKDPIKLQGVDLILSLSHKDD